MALKDLIASKASLDEDAIEKIVANFARFDPDHKLIIFTPDAGALANKAKVLIYLVALQGWPFVMEEPVPVDAKPGDIEEQTGVTGGSLRPILKDLKDRNVILERGGRYSVRAVALSAINAELQGGASITPSKKLRRSSKSATQKPVSEKPVSEQVASENSVSEKSASRKSTLEKPASDKSVSDKSTGDSSQKKARRSSDVNKISSRLAALIERGFFDNAKTLADIHNELHKHAIIVPRTTLPAYLLRAIRSDRLERERQDVDGKAVWVYKAKH